MYEQQHIMVRATTFEEGPVGSLVLRALLMAPACIAVILTGLLLRNRWTSWREGQGQGRLRRLIGFIVHLVVPGILALVCAILVLPPDEVLKHGKSPHESLKQAPIIIIIIIDVTKYSITAL